jgi:hypothetical protein
MEIIHNSWYLVGTSLEKSLMAFTIFCDWEENGCGEIIIGPTYVDDVMLQGNFDSSVGSRTFTVIYEGVTGTTDDIQFICPIETTYDLRVHILEPIGGPRPNTHFMRPGDRIEDLRIMGVIYRYSIDDPELAEGSLFIVTEDMLQGFDRRARGPQRNLIVYALEGKDVDFQGLVTIEVIHERYRDITVEINWIGFDASTHQNEIKIELIKVLGMDNSIPEVVGYVYFTPPDRSSHTFRVPVWDDDTNIDFIYYIEVPNVPEGYVYSVDNRIKEGFVEITIRRTGDEPPNGEPPNGEPPNGEPPNGEPDETPVKDDNGAAGDTRTPGVAPRTGDNTSTLPLLAGILFSLSAVFGGTSLKNRIRK